MILPMALKLNKTYLPLLNTTARYIHLWGGRGRGGSHTATDYFLHLQMHLPYFRGYFMREVFGDVKGSLWQDYKDRMSDNETINSKLFGLNEHELTSIY